MPDDGNTSVERRLAKVEAAQAINQQILGVLENLVPAVAKVQQIAETTLTHLSDGDNRFSKIENDVVDIKIAQAKCQAVCESKTASTNTTTNNTTNNPSSVMRIGIIATVVQAAIAFLSWLGAHLTLNGGPPPGH